MGPLIGLKLIEDLLGVANGNRLVLSGQALKCVFDKVGDRHAWIESRIPTWLAVVEFGFTVAMQNHISDQCSSKRPI